MIVCLYIADRARSDMIGKTNVTLEVGRGIVGDRYAEGVGSYSKSKREVIRHVTIISAEEIRQRNNMHGTKFHVRDTRRNIVVSDFDLYSLIGKEFMIGEVKFRGVEICAPCDIPSNISGQKGFKEAFADGGGIRAEVLSSGSISLMDRLIPC